MLIINKIDSISDIRLDNVLFNIEILSMFKFLCTRMEIYYDFYVTMSSIDRYLLDSSIIYIIYNFILYKFYIKNIM